MEYEPEVYDSACKMHKGRLDGVQVHCLCICLGALWCTSVADLQVDCDKMPLDRRRNMAQVKSALKYKCIPGHPTSFCFSGNPAGGEYDKNFQPIQSKVAEIMDTLPVDRMESLAEVIPSWECQEAHVCLEFHENIF